MAMLLTCLAARINAEYVYVFRTYRVEPYDTVMVCLVFLTSITTRCRALGATVTSKT